MRRRGRTRPAQPSVSAAISTPTQMACCHRPSPRMDAFGARGGCSMSRGWAGSTPSDKAGAPSVTRLIHRIWMASSGKRQTQERRRDHDHDLGRVGGQQVAHEAADVGVDAPPLLHRGDDGREVVVLEDHVRGFLGHVRAGDAHGHADVSLAQGRRVVDAVAGHGHDRAPPRQASTMRSFCSGLVRAYTPMPATRSLRSPRRRSAPARPR